MKKVNPLFEVSIGSFKRKAQIFSNKKTKIGSFSRSFFLNEWKLISVKNFLYNAKKLEDLQAALLALTFIVSFQAGKKEKSEGSLTLRFRNYSVIVA